jgi:hypothetical protein
VNHAETGGLLEAVQGKGEQDNPVGDDKGAQRDWQVQKPGTINLSCFTFLVVIAFKGMVLPDRIFKMSFQDERSIIPREITAVRFK